MRIQQDLFNSQIFGIRMGNVILDNPISSYDQFISEEKDSIDGFDHLTLKIDSNNKQLVNYALSSGYYIVDTLIEYIFKKYSNSLPKINHKCEIRDYQKDDLNVLKKIARNSFEIDRFHSDHNLKKEKCDLYYEKWIENSCNGFADKVIVAIYNNEVVGFTTMKYKDEANGHIVLVAVSDKYRRLGVGTSMIYEGVSLSIYNHNKNGILVGTQINNLVAQKTYIKVGFTANKNVYVLHKYLGNKME